MAVVLDPRIERTRNQLRGAVLWLIEHGGRSDITVQEVTRRAGVNRATFYQHYRDKDELLERTIEELVDEVYDSCAPILAGVDHFRADLVHPSVMQALYKIRERPALFARLIGPGGDSTFNRIFAERTEALSMQALAVQCADEPPAAVPQAVRARASTGMFLSICSMWLDHGCVEPIETIADWYWKLTRPVWFPE